MILLYLYIAFIYSIYIYSWEYTIGNIHFFFSPKHRATYFYLHTCRSKKTLTHIIILNLLHTKISVFFPQNFSWHRAWFMTWAGEKVCLRIRCSRSAELCITHRSTLALITLAHQARRGSVGTVLQVGCNGCFTAEFHPGSRRMHFYWIAALVRTAWGWSPLHIDTDFVKHVKCCGIWG